MSASLPSVSFCCHNPGSYLGDLISAFGEEMMGLKAVRLFVKTSHHLFSHQPWGLLAIPHRDLRPGCSHLNTFLPYPHSTFLNRSHICINVPFLAGQSGPLSSFSFAPSLPYFCLQHTLLADMPPISLSRMDACFLVILLNWRLNSKLPGSTPELH